MKRLKKHAAKPKQLQPHPSKTELLANIKKFNSCGGDIKTFLNSNKVNLTRYAETLRKPTKKPFNIVLKTIVEAGSKPTPPKPHSKRDELFGIIKKFNISDKDIKTFLNSNKKILEGFAKRRANKPYRERHKHKAKKDNRTRKMPAVYSAPSTSFETIAEKKQF